MKISVRLVLAVLLLLQAAISQSMMGTLTGTVTDSSGGVVANANITIKNENSGDLRKTRSNNEGYFTVSSLPAGSYAVLVELEGFAKWRQAGLAFNGGDKRNINVGLSLAGTAAVVEVSADVTALATVDSGERSATISSGQLQDLSMVGRNATEFVKILPGARLASNNGVNQAAYTGEVIGINGAGLGGNQGGLGGTNVNGQGVDITQDGGHTYDPGAPGAATPVNPNTDMVQEVHVMTSNFGAENSKGPVVMNTVSKSGGRDFHGEGYLYARHSDLNANDWFNNYSGTPKPTSSYYFPGGNFGGPVIIPGTNFNKNRDKLFFFEGYEYYKQTIDGGVMRAFVPTDAMRQGNFSAANTFGSLQGNLGTVPTGNGIPNGAVPASMIDPAGMILLNLYPKANTNPLANNGYNYKDSISVSQNSWQSLSRIDYNISDNTKLFVRYNVQRELQVQPTGLWQGGGSDNMVPYPTAINGKNGSDSVSASLTHVFSPTMTSETTFGYTYINFPNSPADPTKLLKSAAKYPYKGIYNSSDSLPVLQNAWDNTIPNLGVAGLSFNPRMDAVKGVTSVGQGFTNVLNTHTIKYGAYFEQVYNRQDNWNTSEGVYTFAAWSTVTGNTYSDILTGNLSNPGYQESILGPQSNVAQRVFDFYVQDSYKLTRRLTLEYGIRMQHMPKPYDRSGFGLAIFNQSSYNNSPDQLNDYTGLSWNKKNSNIPLSGASSRALFYSPRFGLAWDAFGNSKTVVRGGWGRYRSVDNPNSGSYVGPWNTAVGAIGSSCSPGTNVNSCNTFAQVDTIPAATATRGKLGNGPSGGLAGISVMDPKNDEQQLNDSYSFTVSQILPRSVLLDVAYVGSKSNYGPTQQDINYVPFGAMLANPTGNADTYRPRTNYQAITETLNIVKGDYNALQVSASKRQGILTLQANYTLSKQMGPIAFNAALPNFGQDYFWGVTNSNRAHVFNLSYTIAVPNLVKNGMIAKAIANGWQVSGISQAQSGANLIAQSANFSLQQTNASTQINMGTSAGALQPNVTCNPLQGLKSNQFLNGGCFAAPPANGAIGTGAFPYWPGPAYFSNDLSAFKNFSLNEHKKIQLRFSAFNFLNHPLTSFRKGDSNLQLVYDAAGNMTNSNFGMANYKYGHRVVELAAKFMF